jgi:hypothetical protein
MDPAKPQNAAETMMWGTPSTAPEVDEPPIGRNFVKPERVSATSKFLGLMAFSLVCVGLAVVTRAQAEWNDLYYACLGIAASLAIRAAPHGFLILVGRGRD